MVLVRVFISGKLDWHVGRFDPCAMILDQVENLQAGDVVRLQTMFGLSIDFGHFIIRIIAGRDHITDLFPMMVIPSEKLIRTPDEELAWEYEKINGCSC